MTDVVDLDQALRMLRDHSDNPSGFLALNGGNEHFTTPGVDGVVFFRRIGHLWVQFGGPVADPENRAMLLTCFREAACKSNRRVVALQVPESDAALYAGLGFTVNQFGMSYAVELSGFTMRGKKFVKLRNKISRATRFGVTAVEVDYADHANELAAIDRHWLRGKGRFAKEMQFMIGELGGPVQPLRRLFTAQLDGQVVGYISYSPVSGPRPGWLHDLSRRLPDAPPGVMEMINLRAMEQFRDEGVPWLHFGFTPFTGLGPQHALPTANQRIDKLTALLAEKGGAVYPSQSQLEYKLKWNPGYRAPDYLAYEGSLTPRLVWGVLRVTNLL